MSEYKEKRRKLIGFAGVIDKFFNPLNNIEEFRERFKDTNLKILLNAIDGRYAALVKISNGNIEVEGYKNKERENLKRDILNWEGKLETTLHLFLKIANGELSTLSIIIKLIMRKIKIKGVKKVLILKDLFSFIK